MHSTNILMRSLLLAVLMVSAGFVNADQYWFADGLFFSSVIKSEGQKDYPFDQELQRRDLSTSSELFEDQPARRFGAYVGKGARSGALSVEGGIYVDPAAETVYKNAGFGEQHMRTDTAGMVLMGGATWKRLSGKAGLHISFTEADVHTWVLSENGVLSGEFHDTYRDWSAGLSLKLDVRFTRSIKAGCLYLKDVGDMDKIGTDNMLGCGLGIVF
ncbi:MAG: hypothetical protein KME67_03910 [Candidatus Thiodiazotropha sp. (ex Codakia orbicularis)]|nr:hypothetical protein [Candidatus Thiodiazotropha sp. (ex Codakia orbicularis)]